MDKFIKPVRSCVLCALVALLFLASCAQKPAATPQPEATRDPKLEQQIEGQLEKLNPDAIQPYREATVALDAGDLEKSKQLYEQVIALAPNFSAAYRRLGYIELSLNNLDEAEKLSRQALELENIAYNQSALAAVLLQKNTPADSQEAFNLASAAVKELPDDSQANLALLLSAGAINDIETAKQASGHLLELEPNNPLVHFYAGVLAASDRKWEQAEKELLYSQDLGMDAQAVQDVLNQGVSRNALFARILRWGVIALVFWLLGLGILFVAGTSLSRATIQALNKSEPVVSVQVKPEEHRIRSIYRVVITILSLYYYISIPFVILLLFLIVGGAFYVFFLIGSIPIKLSIILFIMLIVSLIAIAKALFSKVSDTPPGKQLKRIDAPELWAFVEDVARKLEIRPVDAIYVSPWIGIAVNEKGSILQKMRGAGRRNLILGMGVLPELTQGQLAAILAHEYGHFSNRDTAGGNLAFQVYASLHQMAQRLIRGGAAQVYNPVWLFVLGYQRIYLRVTQGASRLQEVLADRYAAFTYGSQNFIEGLQSVLRQSIVFPLRANYEVGKSLELNQPINNLYNLQVEEKIQGESEKQFDDVMKRATSDYDSHPAPLERIAWIERLNIPYSPIHENRAPALNLFPNPEDLQRELTTELLKNVRRAQ